VLSNLREKKQAECYITFQLKVNGIYFQFILLPETKTLTFSDAFNSKGYELGRKLDVTDELLRKLKDAKLIDEASFKRIKKLDDNPSKVDELLDVVKRRGDSLLPKFCEILKDIGQLHVLEIILPDGHYLRREFLPDKLDTELIKTVEPRYGLPGDLYSRYIIDDSQFEIIKKEASVSDCAFRLLQSVRQNHQHLKLEAFLQALKEDDQPHVMNYVITDGQIGDEFGLVRPLSNQQRRRLWSRNVFIKLDLHNGRFLDRLRATTVISDMQHKDVDVKSKQNHRESIQLLIEILERRSVANLSQFIECLDETKQSSIVQMLNEKGAVVRLRTTNDQPEMSEQLELQIEAMFEKLFVDPSYHKRDELVFRLCELMEKNGYEIKWVKRTKSIAWYILCRNLLKLESLKRLCQSPSNLLARLLQCIFTQVCVSSSSLQLSVQWNTEDFENCRRFLTETSGRPFELPNCHDEPPTETDFTVSITVCESNLKIQL
jgi:uncharacterized Fe-S cluster-containing protein